MSKRAINAANRRYVDNQYIEMRTNPEKYINIEGDYIICKYYKKFRNTMTLHTKKFDNVEYGIDIANYVEFGASPRATLFLAQAARVTAFLQGRAYITPQDIKIIAPDVLRHRIILSFEAEAEQITTDHIIKSVFDSVEVP